MTEELQREVTLSWELATSSGHIYLDAQRRDGWKIRLDLGPEEEAVARIRSFLEGGSSSLEQETRTKSRRR